MTGLATQPRPPAPVPPLVDCAWLRAHHDDVVTGRVVLLEVDEETSLYYEGHVPGASPVDWLDDVHHPSRRGFLDPEGVAKLLSRLGVTPQTHVVLLGDAANVYASSLFWLLRHHRHGPLSLVDGGRTAWLQDGGGLQTEVPVREPAHYPVPAADPLVRATRDDILDRFVAAPPGTALLDCRTPHEFRGYGTRGVDLPLQHHRLPGHVPGARNLDSSLMVDPQTHRFRPLKELAGLFASRGVTAATEVALYCRVAERSALLWFALHELLGHTPCRVYDGGWVEYGSLVGAPVHRDT